MRFANILAAALAAASFALAPSAAASAPEKNAPPPKDASAPGGSKDGDAAGEKPSPVRYRNMDKEHSKPIKGVDRSFKDIEMAFTDKFVLEALFDYSKPKDIDVSKLAKAREYAVKGALPFEFYAAVPERRLRDKLWEKFVGEKLSGDAAKKVTFPIYVDAGMDLPRPASLPWFHLVGPDGVLRYSGSNPDEAAATFHRLARKLPAADPVFAYAKPGLLADEIAAIRKTAPSGPRLRKAVDAAMKKYQRTDAARAAEARHLLIGIDQANGRRIDAIAKAFGERAGKAYADLLDFLDEWPSLESDPRVRYLKMRVTKNPDIDKLAKMEAELARLKAWNAEKPADVKKREAARDALRKKAEKFSSSPAPAIQGEAMAILSDLGAL